LKPVKFTSGSIRTRIAWIVVIMALAGRRSAMRTCFKVGHSISGFEPVGGNRAADGGFQRDHRRHGGRHRCRQDHVHLLFYIWLPDNNGCKVVEALMRAAARGVTCRAMADDLGSRP
jgi:cardiolipin synthase